MCDPFMLSFGVGVAQLLDNFSKTSLASQKLWNFPGSMAISSKELKLELRGFHWKTQPLDLTLGIDTPASFVENLKEVKFAQKLSKGVKTSAAKVLNLLKQEDYDHELGHSKDKLCASDVIDQEMSMEGLTDEQLLNVERKMNGLYSEILKKLDSSVIFTPLVEMCVTAFHETEWYKKAVNESDKTTKAEEIVKLLLDCLKPDDFDIDTIVPEYIDFLQFKSSQGDSNISVEELYHLFSKKQAEHTTFMKLFEFINIKSFSEAYCESVGSMMNMIVDKGRNLADGNFSRELIFALDSPHCTFLQKIC